MSKKRDEFIGILVKELCDRSTPTGKTHFRQIIDAAALLMRHGRTYGRICEMQCNGTPAANNPHIDSKTFGRLQAEHEEWTAKRSAALEKRISAICAEIGCTAEFQGDPRGATVKVILPGGASNSFGGVGWCVPNS